MVRPNGNALPFDEALAILDEMTLPEISELFTRISKALEDTAAPKA
jgi:hypothetical protein